MRIVVLDGRAANPGDLSWDGLGRLGELEVHDRTPPLEVVARARGAEAVLTNKTVLDGETLAKLAGPGGLGYVGVLATGHDVVDVTAARSLGVTVTNVPGYATESVAQHALALILALANRVGGLDAAVHAGRWAEGPDWCFWDEPLVELSGLTLGVVGLGAVGRKVAALGLALGMRVVAHDVSPARLEGVEDVDLDAVFRTADVVSLHCPLTDRTRGMANEARLASMRTTAFLVNTARGGLVDEEALARALDEGRIAGAAVDVLGEEPPAAGSPLVGAPNCIVTPHVAWATAAARRRLIESAAMNLEAFLAGRPVNVVS